MISKETKIRSVDGNRNITVSWATFRKVCELVCNLHTNEIRELEKIARKRINDDSNRRKALDEDLAYEIICMDPIAKKIIEKNGYVSWERLKRRCSEYLIDEEIRQDEINAAIAFALVGGYETPEELSE